MVRSIQILLAVLLLASASGVKAQTSVPCGVVDIEGLSEVDPGIVLVFKAKLARNIATEFKWSVSAGTIMSGQGTEEIAVDTTGLSAQEITATVELAGVPPDCKSSASTTTHVNERPLVCGLAFDTYGDLKFEDEKARLDNFAIQLSNVPLSSGYIMMSAGTETFKNETAERLARAGSYLVGVREINRNRIVTLDCGFTSGLQIHLYIVTPGMTPPYCFNPAEIPLSQIKFTKPRPKLSKTRR